MLTIHALHRAGKLTAFVFALLIAPSVVHADKVNGIYGDLPYCDDHSGRSATEELGDPSVFSVGQQIDHLTTFTDITSCIDRDSPNIPNALVVMTNLTDRHWTDLYYVGDPLTSFSNVDGFGDAGVDPQRVGLAFRIDSEGINRPLVAESITANNIFEPGEEWRFVVQDYSSPLGAADSFMSVGFADASIGSHSAASVVQFVPEPAGLCLSLFGLLGLAASRK